MKNPPILISVIGFFVAMAGFGWLFFGIRLLGFDWFGLLGDVPAFEFAGLWGWLAILGGVLWLAAAFGLWSLQPWAWMFAMFVAGFAIFEAFLYMIQYPGSGIGLAMMLMPGPDRPVPDVGRREGRLRTGRAQGLTPAPRARTTEAPALAGVSSCPVREPGLLPLAPGHPSVAVLAEQHPEQDHEAHDQRDRRRRSSPGRRS